MTSSPRRANAIQTLQTHLRKARPDRIGACLGTACHRGRSLQHPRQVWTNSGKHYSIFNTNGQSDHAYIMATVHLMPATTYDMTAVPIVIAPIVTTVPILTALLLLTNL